MIVPTKSSVVIETFSSEISSEEPTSLSSRGSMVSSGDAVWILTSAFIIFTMISGFGLVESGKYRLSPLYRQKTNFATNSHFIYFVLSSKIESAGVQIFTKGVVQLQQFRSFPSMTASLLRKMAAFFFIRISAFLILANLDVIPLKCFMTFTFCYLANIYIILYFHSDDFCFCLSLVASSYKVFI